MSTDAREIRFTVYGNAKPAGSKRGFKTKTGRVAIVDANPNSRDWKNAVSSQAASFFAGELLDGPLLADFKFYQPRPKGHYYTGARKDVVRTSAPPYPTSKPDVLKLARGVEDALTGVVYFDDSQIVREVLSKDYGSPARVEVTIRQLEVAKIAATNGHVVAEPTLF